MRIAINGAGIAGPALAYWLCRAGHEVLLVEKAPKLRSGGYAVDFWGVGYDVAEKMGLIPQIRELGDQVKEMRIVNRRGRKCGGFATEMFGRLLKGRFTTLRRSDLAATIYGALDGKVETLFDDSIAGITDEGGCVRVSFDRADPREVDLVIGADGLHSRVRELVFGPCAEFEVALGFYIAAFEVAGYRPRDELVYVTHGVPGRQVSRFSMRDDRTLFLFVARGEYLSGETLTSDPQRKAALARVFGDVGWECPRILAELEHVGDLYFDRVSQIRMDRWTRGRTALLGDAAACISLLGGEGAGLAMAEAYVLAGELKCCGGDHAAAFARYEQRLMPVLKRKQKIAARFASSFAPKTSFGLTVRNLATRVLRLPFLAELLLARFMRDDVKLPDYGFS
jgi:2-polyprenyl-6-methoxyphenol hydroxylase-like FAD-dependent oxidoreductase